MTKFKNFKNMERLENCVCSNFDHVIHDDVIEKLKENDTVYATYPCWDCHCKVWYDKDKQKFGCQIWVYGSAVDEIYENTVKDIMSYVCNSYGNN